MSEGAGMGKLDQPQSNGWRGPDDRLDYNLLDPGIRDVVWFLRSNGFRTTDSGDGVTKRATRTDPDALSYPHVFMTVLPEDLVKEAVRLRLCLARIGLPTFEQGPDVATLQIHATYDPVSGIAILALTGLTSVSS